MTPTDTRILASAVADSPYLAVCKALPLGAQKIRAFVVKATHSTSGTGTSSRVHP